MFEKRKSIGWKTIVGGLLYGVVTIAEAQAWIDPQLADTFRGLLAPWLAYSVRDAIRKQGE
jgi:hypothetical protein